jgi:hypothetical protein
VACVLRWPVAVAVAGAAASVAVDVTGCVALRRLRLVRSFCA